MLVSVHLISISVLSLVLATTAAGNELPPNIDIEKLSQLPLMDRFEGLYNKQCGDCHGEALQGTTQGPPLAGIELRHGDSIAALTASIAEGFPDAGMPAWAPILGDTWVENLAYYVAERRQGTTLADFRVNADITMPSGVIATEQAAFRLETIATDLAGMVYALAPLPDGSFLVTERLRGLRTVSADGVPGPLVAGTPKAYDDAKMTWGQMMGLGWIMDVALHPDYAANGWVYLSYADRCEDCNAASRESGKPVSMNKLVRGRIRDNTWVDEQVIWQANVETYSESAELAAGGRISFDNNGYMYFTVGMKAFPEHLGIQDLDQPYGKVHRAHDDGRVPADNPFVGVPDALPTIWTLGHRSPEGLEMNPLTGEHWNTEMGPRGGDELNRLVPGANYGWPLYTSGINYDGSRVDFWDELGIELPPEQVTFPVVDLTPAPAISSFVFYQGDEFPAWRNQIIVGMLKSSDLWRFELDGNEVVKRELLIEDLARFRDIVPGPGGELYLLLESNAGSRIVRMVPAEARAASLVP